MKHYILDTHFFVISRDYYENIFPTFWTKLQEAVSHNLVSSVEQVKEELNNYGGEQEHLKNWVKNNKHIFTQPNNEEMKKVKEIFSINNFQSILPQKIQLKGGPFADPFIISKAVISKSIVVTGEKPAKKDKFGNIQGLYKIPEICQYYNIDCVSPEKFMQQQEWRF